MSNATNNNKTLKVCDDLDLANLPVPNIPKDIIFPDELNKYLRDQVQYLTHENGMLYKNLSSAEVQLKESTTKITSLHSQLEEYQLMCPKNSFASSSTNLASGKIVELSKKLRERNSEMEIYKTKCSKLQQYILSMEKEKDKAEEVVPKKPKNELEEQVKLLQDKLSGTNIKLCEARNSNSQLKNDLKLANKLLQQEVGESFDNLQTMININSNWRGRAQIICDLQQKNSDLREKLKTYQEKAGHTVNEAPIQTKWDKRMDSLTKENAELKNYNQETKRKLDATRARNKVLESEYTMLRAKMAAITEQTDRDHEIITSLSAKVAHSQEIQNEATRQKYVALQKVEQENKDLQLEISKQACKMNNLTAELEEQRREIEHLRKKFRGPQPLVPSNAPNTDVKTIKILEAERLRLLELTKLINDRVEGERTAHAATEAKFRTERQKVAKLEAKVARLQLDQQNDISSSYSSYSLKSKELDSNKSEDHLELVQETLKAMETRLQIERQEHKSDIEEFSRILKNYGYVQSND